MNKEVKEIIKGIDRALLHLTPGNISHRVPNIRQMLVMLEKEIELQTSKNNNDDKNAIEREWLV